MEFERLLMVQKSFSSPARIKGGNLNNYVNSDVINKVQKHIARNPNSTSYEIEEDPYQDNFFDKEARNTTFDRTNSFDKFGESDY